MHLLNKILVAVKFEDPTHEILQTGKKLHDIFHSSLILLHVLPERLNKQQIGKLVRKAAHNNLDRLKQKLTGEGVEKVETIIEEGSVFDKTIDVAGEQEANVILMGPGRRNANDPGILGTSVEKVIRKTNTPVWVVRGFKETGVEKILCPVDFSDPSKRALENAIMLSHKFGADLKVISVFEPEESYSRWIKADMEEANNKAYKEYRQQYDEFMDQFEFRQVKWDKILKRGSVVVEITKYAREQGIDLLIMGTTGRSGLSRILIGSVTEKVIREVQCSVITTKSRHVLDFQFELKMGELANHYNKGEEAFSNKDYETALTHYLWAHKADMFHFPTLIRLYEIYRSMEKNTKADQYKQAAIRVIESLYNKELARDIIDHFELS